MNSSENATKKAQILALIKQGELSDEQIATKVNCGIRYVKRIRATNNEQPSGQPSKNLPATLTDDLVLVNTLAESLQGQDGFRDGVKSVGIMLMFCLRVLGQISAVTTMGKTGELQELVGLAQQLQPQTDPAVIATLGGVTESMRGIRESMQKANAPKTPEAMLMEQMLPMFGQVLTNVMGSMSGVKVPQIQPILQPGVNPQQAKATEEEVEAAFGNG